MLLILGPDLASRQQRDKREKESERIELKKEIGGSTVTSDALLISVCVASCLLKMSIQLLLGNIALTLYYNNFSRNSALVIFLTIKIKKLYILPAIAAGRQQYLLV